MGDPSRIGRGIEQTAGGGWQMLQGAGQGTAKVIGIGAELFGGDEMSRQMEVAYKNMGIRAQETERSINPVRITGDLPENTFSMQPNNPVPNLSMVSAVVEAFKQIQINAVMDTTGKAQFNVVQRDTMAAVPLLFRDTE